jgi:hypothetical protein
MSWSGAAFPSRRSSVRNTWSLPNPFQRRRRCYWRCTRRTIPLALFALGAIYKQATPALLILGALAGAVQLLDAGIGLFEHDLGKCAGPLFIAVLQFFVVYLLHISVRITP